MGLFSRKQEAPASAAPPLATPASSSRPVGDGSRAQLRTNARQVRRSDRELQAERARLQADEKRLKAEIKSLVRSGRTAEARMLSKNLIQNRNTQTKLFGASTQLSAIQNQGSLMASQAKVVGAMENASNMMSQANQAANPERMMKVAQNYELEAGKMQLAQEMTDDVLDDIVGGDDVDTEADAALNSVLEEIGLDVAGSMSAAPVARPRPVARPAAAAPINSEEDQLLARIAALEGRR